ncbi:uncharacterized protein LOC103398546 isoform X2 [Cynoglossus semilaevis]|nr:uncharacterized protein LOC103398546 isoform X2 [Cynoglossus semilaevis]
MIIVFGEKHNATVWRDGHRLESKIIDIYSTIKPKRPEIRPVEEVNGKFLIKWKTNMKDLLDSDLTSNVTYWKKGDTKKVSMTVKPAISNGLKIYEIHSRELEPSTDYVVSVKSDLNNIFSESSDEMEFTTPASPNNGLKVVMASISVVAVVLSSLIFGCFFKIKKKWWDAGARWPDSKLLDMKSTEEKLLKPELIITSGVHIVPVFADDIKSYTSNGSLIDSSVDKYQQSSIMGSGSSSLGYAKTEPADVVTCVHEALAKVLPHIVLSPLGNSLTNNDGNVQVDVANSKLLSFTNMTYSGCPPQIMTDLPEYQEHTRMFYDSGYHPSEAEDMVTAADHQLLFNVQQVVQSLVPVDMSYQQCSTDSGVSSLSYSSSNNANVETDSFNEGLSWEIKQHGKSLEGTMSEESPFLGCLHPGPKNIPLVIDDYQAV